MVQIAPFLQALSVVSQVAPNASPAGSNGLAARQSSGFDPSSLPPQCQSPCQVINTMQSCSSSLSCLCASSIGTNLAACMNCMAAATLSVASQAQSALDSWNEACSGSLSVSAGGSSPTGTTGGSTTGGSTGGSTTGNTGGSSTGGSSSGGTTSGGTTSGGTSPDNPLGTKGGAMSMKASVGLAIGFISAVLGSLLMM
ncbi:hypothetical protein BJ138DRAFT_1176223 [Hygrophoropsis aurantiaca]|uniref:Uncharacterized protein n=1 Tax=Hygrophoropsis aurantiaca TaxID=72124 RepID=A0ACB8ASL4_9AGAM|nr:hypothetical protein BJ138DRAFT_1176223 [Hygrophoropsis aurantiaca]